ncbi:MAG: ParA family protein [Acidimicrobiales bacterium]
MRILATYNIKGGVGKTSAAVNFAALAAADGTRTLLWDLDPQGAATFLFRIKPKVRGGASKLVRRKSDIWELLRGTDIEGLDVLPADFSYRNMDLVLDDAKRPVRRLASVMAPLAAEYDLVILDCPPSISLVSESVFYAADALLVPIIPTTLSLRTFDQLTRFTSRKVTRPPQIVGFFSMVDRRKRLHLEMLQDVPPTHPSIVSAAIPAASEVERMGVHRAPVAAFAPRSVAARAYAELWREIRARVQLEG